jgi:lysophospholipase L1-like esterase
MKKIITVFIAACLLLVSCGGGASSEESSATASQEASSEAESQATSSEPTSDKSEEDSMVESQIESDTEVIGTDDGVFTYYAFGDSIAYGYGLQDPATMCYGALFASQYDGIKYTNYAVSGHKTSDMLNVLDTVDVSDADLITISIGANNLLGYALDAIYGVFNTYGSEIFTDYAAALMGNGDTSKVEGFIKALEAAFTNDDFKAKAQAGLVQLNDELPKIFKKIQSQNDKCVIIIQTIYNPYKGIALGIPGGYSFDFSAACEEYLKPYNNAIKSIAAEYGCRVLDVYTDFDSSKTDLINAGIIMTPSVSFSYDPHPNTAGHEEIAAMLHTEWESILNTDE